MKKKTIYEPVKVEDATEEDKKQKFVVLRDYSVNGLAAWYDFPQGNIHNIHYLKQSEKYVFDDAEIRKIIIDAFEEGKQMMFMETNKKIVKYKTSAEYANSKGIPEINPEQIKS